MSSSTSSNIVSLSSVKPSKRHFPPESTGQRRAKHKPLACLQIDLLEASAGRLPPDLHTYRVNARRALELFMLVKRQRDTGSAIGRGKRAEVAFPGFERLSQETKLYLYALAALAHGLGLNRYCVLTFSPDDVVRVPQAGMKPVALVGDFINRVLEPLFRRAGRRLVFFWNLEWHAERESESEFCLPRNQRLRTRPGTGHDAFHVNLYLGVPDELDEKVRQAFHSQVGKLTGDRSLPLSIVTRKNANSPLHITAIRDDKSFGNTGFSGLLGVAEYGAKGLGKVRQLGSVTQLTGASQHVRKAARVYYELHVARLIDEPQRVLEDLARSYTRRAA